MAWIEAAQIAGREAAEAKEAARIQREKDAAAKAAEPHPTDYQIAEFIEEQMRPAEEIVHDLLAAGYTLDTTQLGFLRDIDLKFPTPSYVDGFTRARIASEQGGDHGYSTDFHREVFGIEYKISQGDTEIGRFRVIPMDSASSHLGRVDYVVPTGNRENPYRRFASSDHDPAIAEDGIKREIAGMIKAHPPVPAVV